MYSKEAEIEKTMSEEEIGVLFVTESDVRGLDDNNVPLIAGRKALLQQTGPNDDKTRIMALVDPSLTNKIKLRLDVMSADFASIWLEFDSGRGIYLIGGFYREWKTREGSTSTRDQGTSLGIFLDQFERARVETRKVVVIGDNNLNMRRWDDSSYHLRPLVDRWKEVILENALNSHEFGITFARTRGKKSVMSELDHAFSTPSAAISGVERLQNAMSDHSPIVLTIGQVLRRSPRLSTFITRRSTKDFSLEPFLSELAAAPWDHVKRSDCPSVQTRIFNVIWNTVLDRHAPEKRMRITNTNRNDISEVTTKLMAARNAARRKAVKTRMPRKTAGEGKLSKKLRNNTTNALRRDIRLRFRWGSANGDRAAGRTQGSDRGHCWRIARRPPSVRGVILVVFSRSHD